MHNRLRLGTLAAALTIFAVMLSAGPAEAWTGTVAGSEIVLADDAAAADVFVITAAPGGYAVGDASSPFAGPVPAPCTFDADAQVLTCPGATRPNVNAAAQPALGVV